MQALDGAGGERLRYDAANALVLGTLHAQKRVGDLVPQGSGGDTLGGEIEAGRDLEATVTKDGTY